jgi:hypothetical protein
MHRINLTNIISMDALWIFEWNRNCLPFWRNWVLPRFLWGSCVVFSRSLFALFHLAIVLFCPSIYGFWLPILYVPRNIWIYTPLYNWVHVALSLAFCVMLCRLLFVILSFFADVLSVLHRLHFWYHPYFLRHHILLLYLILNGN